MAEVDRKVELTNTSVDPVDISIWFEASSGSLQEPAETITLTGGSTVIFHRPDIHIATIGSRMADLSVNRTR